MKITVVLPTIRGREQSLAMVVANYQDRRAGHRLQILTPKDHPSWGAACNAARDQANGDVLHFGNDDLEPLDGWADAMLRTLANDEIPASQVWDHTFVGECANLAADGPPGHLTAFSRTPALTREMFERIGPFPDLHYYCDNWISDAARRHGWQTRVTDGYRFVHHWHPHGRLDQGDWHSRDYPLYQQALLAL